MLKRHEVEILLKAGHPKTEVARLSGVSLRSVKRIAEEEPVVHVDDQAERSKREIGRPSTVAAFRKQRFSSSSPIWLRWRSYGECGSGAIRGARRRSTRWSPRFGPRRPSRWFGLKGSQESSVSMILEKWSWSSLMVRARESISLPRV